MSVPKDVRDEAIRALRYAQDRRNMLHAAAEKLGTSEAAWDLALDAMEAVADRYAGTGVDPHGTAADLLARGWNLGDEVEVLS